MTEIVVSPLPKWTLDTFEGKIIAAWIGYSDIGGDRIEFAGDTESEDDEDIVLLEMDAEEVAELARLADEAGTPVGKELARVLRDPEGTEVLNEFFGKIDISSLRSVIEFPNEAGKGDRIMEVDDLLASLVSRFTDEIPYAEVTWARGATLVTPDGVEWFKKASARDKRLEDYLASVGILAQQP
ncbi:hypothetical protein [Rhizobium leguminosarum]|uniref:hypothetical protein n=1 Tax=Rhizobium leguminosarum TaxID=384 RepID=UPI002E1660F1|nr:hypothetical protein U8Q02_40510 [Rhizobium leguminosarum]